MSANLCLIAWNDPIGTPNCSRCFAYSSVMSKIVCAVPTISSASATVASSSARRSARSRPTRPVAEHAVAADAHAVEARRARAGGCRRARAPAWSSTAATGTTTARTPSSPAVAGSRATTTSSSTASPSTTKRFVPASTASSPSKATVASTVGRIERAASPRRSRASPVSSPAATAPRNVRLLLGGAGLAHRGHELRDGGEQRARARSPGRAPRRGSRASSMPRPMPPCASATVSAGQPSSTIVAQSAVGSFAVARRPRGRGRPGSPCRARRGSSRAARPDRW